MHDKGLALVDIVTELHKFVALIETKDQLAKVTTPLPSATYPARTSASASVLCFV